MKTIINEKRKKGKFLMEFDTREELLAAKSLLTAQKDKHDLWLKITSLELAVQANEIIIKSLQNSSDYWHEQYKYEQKQCEHERKKNWENRLNSLGVAGEWNSFCDKNGLDQDQKIAVSDWSPNLKIAR